MSPRRVSKQIVCSECGRALQVLAPTVADVELTAPTSDDDLEEPIPLEPSPSVEVILESGPVCPRCAEHR